MVQSSSDSTLPKNVVLLALALLVLAVVFVGLGGFGALFGLVWLLGSVAVTVALLYLLYRFVLAHERIADAQERRVRIAERGGDAAASGPETQGNARLDEFENDGDSDPDIDPSDA